MNDNTKRLLGKGRKSAKTRTLRAKLKGTRHQRTIRWRADRPRTEAAGEASA